MDKSSTHKTPRRGIQVAHIVDVVRKDIVTGALQGGHKLGQENLAKRFSVSRMPVREALRQLEAEGLVRFHPNKSAVVVPASIADLREISQMRIAAETLALRHALPELTNSQISRAQDIQNQLEAAPINEFGVLNTQFHAGLYAPCAMPRLIAHIDVLGVAADRYLRMTIGALEYAEKSHAEHRELL
ncbi:MAG: GntR family transcriptional regulator, partial [Hyphomicrobiales bacterium]